MTFKHCLGQIVKLATTGPTGITLAMSLMRMERKRPQTCQAAQTKAEEQVMLCVT